MEKENKTIRDNQEVFPLSEESQTNQEQNGEDAQQVVSEIEVPSLFTSSVESRNDVPPNLLAGLDFQDLKREKRMMANRLSAMRAKEKKKLYTCMLEHKLQVVRSHADAVSAQLTLMQRESSCLSDEHTKLKQFIFMLLKQIQLQDAMNEEIRNEIRFLKMVGRINGPNLEVSNPAGNNNNNASGGFQTPFRLNLGPCFIEEEESSSIEE